MAYVLCEALVKPEIIPPFHGNQIAKPMMRHLMHNRIAEPNHLLNWNRILKYIQIIKSHNACILHGPPFVLMRKYLIILTKRIRIPEIVLKKLHRFICHFLNEWHIHLHVFVEGFDAVVVHRDVLVCVRRSIFFVGAYHEAEQIRWQGFCCWESSGFVGFRQRGGEGVEELSG